MKNLSRKISYWGSRVMPIYSTITNRVTNMHTDRLSGAYHSDRVINAYAPHAAQLDVLKGVAPEASMLALAFAIKYSV